MGRKNPSPVDVSRGLPFFKPGRTVCGACCLYLLEAGQVGVAQDQKDVGMRNQSSIRIDDIGTPILADLDGRHDIPDEFQIDFRDVHARIASRAAKRQRHVGFGLVAKVNGSVVDLPPERFGEFGLARHRRRYR